MPWRRICWKLSIGHFSPRPTRTDASSSMLSDTSEPKAALRRMRSAAVDNAKLCRSKFSSSRRPAMRSRMYLRILSQRDASMEYDFEGANYTGAVGRFRCIRVGSSSSSSGSESGFSYIGRSSASDSELSSISSIEMILDAD